MRKYLLIALAVVAIPVCVSAQTRMTISEEFTGENCGPCAGTNPGFWHLCDTAPNLAKIIHISYMEPIPTSGWYYMRTQALSDSRRSYYSISSAPHHIYDGHTPSASSAAPGHPGYFTQAEIDAEYAIASPFNITCSNVWNATFDSIITTVNITCVTAYTAASPYLRAALIHTDNFATSPGSNGETTFENVVQAMYPDATGTSLSGTTWTAGTTRTIVLRGACPNWVDKSDSPSMVVWIQNDADKSIAQAAQAIPLPDVNNDASATNVVPSSSFACANDGSYAFTHTVKLSNTGANTITSADIYYKVDGGSWTMYHWTGSLSIAANATVTMPSATATVAGPGYHYVYDSVANVNATNDPNGANNVYGSSFFVESKTAAAMPYSTSLEGTDYAKHYASNYANDGFGWSVWSGVTGHTGTYAAKYNCYNASTTVGNIFTLPVVTTSTSAVVDFYVADCQIATTNTDMLEVVYSADCGATWTSIWNMSGTALSTVPVNSSTYYYPAAAAEYVKRRASLSAVPAGAIIAFRATSGHGNNMWLDDINIHSTVAVANVTSAAGDVSIYPNPTTDVATLSFQLSEDNNVNIQVIDEVGRVVKAIANEKMNIGMHSYTISTSDFAAGVYSVIIRTEGGTTTQRLTVAK